MVKPHVGKRTGVRFYGGFGVLVLILAGPFVGVLGGVDTLFGAQNPGAPGSRSYLAEGQFPAPIPLFKKKDQLSRYRRPPIGLSIISPSPSPSCCGEVEQSRS